MDLQEALTKALCKLEDMSIEEFEKGCIKAGYTPERKNEENHDKH